MAKKQIVLSFFGVIFLMVVLLSVSFPETKKAFGIPNQIGSYSLTTKMEGDEAIQHISQLHGKDIQIKNGYILEYQNDNQEFSVVWISESTSENEAKKLFNKMNKLMDQSKMYSDHQIIEVDGSTIQYVFGMDMDNYYYQKGSQVIWISVPMDVNQKFIKIWLKAF